MQAIKRKIEQHFSQLALDLEGDLHYNSLMRTLYATDASVYRELPDAVALPKTVADIKCLVRFAQQHQIPLIPRTAGTSLAGQCVGKGIVVDVSKYFNRIIELNQEEAWVRVQPGVIRDELNLFLKPYGLFFGPNTSTANRCMIGGMVGNNSCGTTSIIYGSTREHTLELKTILSDASEATFKAVHPSVFRAKCQQKNLEGTLYRHIHKVLSDQEQQNEIRTKFPKASIRRRNTGYAVDFLLESEIFTENGEAFNFCKLLCGSEGTLAFTTEIKLNLNALPKPKDVVVAAHFDSVQASMRATQIAMEHQPSACELMDKIILDCTKDNIEQSKNRAFVVGDPAALLLVEFRGDTIRDAEVQANRFILSLKRSNLSYAVPIIQAPKTKGVWDLRKAGLGLLANIPGDKKAVACIEDTAVDLADLPNYVADFSETMKGFGQQSVYYAHAGAGELHLRPILDLKKSEDVQQFYEISKASAELVKKYGGSLSGEHGDGRVRAPFIPLMVGAKNYALFQDLKKTWDAFGIFNPNKIVDTPPMNTALRYQAEQHTPDFRTVLDFSAVGGILRMAEKCNGSGDCRKLPLSGGTMCPSYQATRNEKDTTRARANALREFLSKNQSPNAFDHPEIKEVMDLCLSCKGCTSECPSNVDMSSLKAEFLHQYYQTNGVPLRATVFGNITRLNALGSKMTALTNWTLTNALTSRILKRILGVAPQRSLPKLHPFTLRRWYQKHYRSPKKILKTVYLFCDEFSNYNDVRVGIKAIQLLYHLGYEVKIIAHPESGRTHLSKGLLKTAQRLAKENVSIFKSIISSDTPLLGIEPSAILSFRDEYPRLVDKKEQKAAKVLAKNALLIDEFLAKEAELGNINPSQFTAENKNILLHGHCHQKALSSISPTAFLLSLPENYSVETIPSGCCGMAGSFGYEKEHYEVSMQIGELVLFPSIRKAEGAVVAAPGTSCRHQIMDGTDRIALHPVEILLDAFTGLV